MTIKEFIEQTCGTPATVIASSLTAAMTVRVAVAYSAPIQITHSHFPIGSIGLRQRLQPQPDRPTGQHSRFGSGAVQHGDREPAGGIRSFLQQRQFARSNRVSQEMVDAYLASAQQPNAEYSALSFVRGDLCFDLADYMPRLTVPTAMIWGKKSQFTSVEVGSAAS